MQQRDQVCAVRVPFLPTVVRSKLSLYSSPIRWFQFSCRKFKQTWFQEKPHSRLLSPYSGCILVVDTNLYSFVVFWLDFTKTTGNVAWLSHRKNAASFHVKSSWCKPGVGANVLSCLFSYPRVFQRIRKSTQKWTNQLKIKRTVSIRSCRLTIQIVFVSLGPAHCDIFHSSESQ